MSFPARDNQITFGSVLAWLVVIVLAVIVLFLIFQSDGPAPDPAEGEWSTRDAPEVAGDAKVRDEPQDM